MKKQILLFFVKLPEPGAVKTRIAEDLGPQKAAEIYKSLVKTVIGRLPKGLPVRVCFAPDDQEEAVRAWLKPQFDARKIPLQMEPQLGSDLGERMSAAFGSAFADGFDHVAIIGSDCPEISEPHLDEAWAALEDVDVVIGPSPDGGYYLLAMRDYFPQLFENIPWSSPDTLDTTMERAMENDIEVSWLEELQDIDTAEDWQNLQSH